MNHRTKSLRLGALLAVLFALAAPPSIFAQQPGYQPSDYYDLVTTSQAAVSPSGAFLAFTATRVVEEDNKRMRRIWLQAISRGRPEGDPFPATAERYDSHSPVWSPDGSTLAFSSARGGDGGSIWFLSVLGPGAEAKQIDGVTSSPVWSPDGEWIAFAAAPEEEGGAAEPENGARRGWIAPDAVSRTLDSERFDGRVITSTRYKRDGRLALQPHYSVQPKRQLMLVQASGGEPRQLTELPFSVGTPVWSPRGDVIFVTGNELEDDELSKEYATHIWAQPISGDEAFRVTSGRGRRSALALSPDGRVLAFLKTVARGEQTDLYAARIGRDGRLEEEPRSLTGEWDLSPRGPAWTPSGDALLFSAQTRGSDHLFRADPSGGAEIRQVTRGARRLSSFAFSKGGDFMAYAATDADSPPELFVSRMNGSDESRATDFNDGWLSRRTLMAAREIVFQASGGPPVQGWIVPPANFEEGKRYPLILKIHGGPHSAYGQTFFPTFHVLSASGFFVLYTNPRGSSGYGHEFQYATRGEWGIVDREDYLAGVDAAIEAYPEIDPARIGISGGSYGGFMTNWLTATTDRFASAATSRSITNWESWWGTSDAQGLTEYEFYGPPWEQRDLYRRLSPISYVENVRAPTLIIHSEQDYRTPIGDGEQWFMSLRKLGVPVELVRYPRSSHGLSRTGEPWLLVDRLERIRSWFAHTLGEDEPRTDAR